MRIWHDNFISIKAIKTNYLKEVTDHEKNIRNNYGSGGGYSFNSNFQFR